MSDDGDRQKGLFDVDVTTIEFSEYGAARTEDPPTYHQAAMALDASRYEKEVLSCLRKYGAMTQQEVVGITGFPNETITPRFAPLRRKKLIRDTGERRKFDPTKRKGIVWDLTDIGESFCEIHEL